LVVIILVFVSLLNCHRDEFDCLFGDIHDFHSYNHDRHRTAWIDMDMFKNSTRDTILHDIIGLGKKLVELIPKVYHDPVLNYRYNETHKINFDYICENNLLLIMRAIFYGFTSNHKIIGSSIIFIDNYEKIGNYKNYEDIIQAINEYVCIPLMQIASRNYGLFVMKTEATDIHL